MVIAYDLVASAGCLGLVGLCSVPSLKSALWTRSPSKHKLQHSFDLYEDEDGTATRESEEAYSDLIQRSCILVFSILGSTLSLIFVVLATIDKRSRCVSHHVECLHKDNSIWLEQCLVLPTWLLLLAQGSIIVRSRNSVQKYGFGIFGAISSLLHSSSLLAQAVGWWSYHHAPSAAKIHYVLQMLQFTVALFLSVTFTLIPRRPDVYNGNKLVDRQYTVSFLSRAAYSWATPILNLTTEHKNLQVDDLPMISHEVRAATLLQRFEQVAYRGSFWRVVVLANRSALILQWTLQALQAFSNFFPQLALLVALRLLEERDAGQDRTLQLWLLVVVLGISDTAAIWLETSLFYVCYNKMGCPVYEQISALVFAKAIRKKDVKGIAEGADLHEGTENPKGAVANGDVGATVTDHADESGSNTGSAKTKQSIINLIGVDGKRISDCATYNCMAFGACLKIMIAVIFLVRLIGWIPLLAGFGAFAALFPFNWWVTSKYTQTQDMLMKIRDTKMAVVTEALQGIRQIKFSALEREWYDKISKTRRKELRTQWRAFCYDTALISVWIFGPVCLSAISLAVYAIIHKQLSASVAFTTMSVFESLEVTLAVVPEVITEILDAFISCKRIQEYLESPDLENNILPGEAVEFDNATMAWPVDAKEQEESAFKLRDVSLKFPTGQLSVISGKTGSGKSLLLSSIIGEVDILSGVVTVPKAPTLSERHDQKATRDNWNIPSAIAYVSQIPWIENATIMDNITFGLPLINGRYRDVLEASALVKDLEILPDGDMTDIGANGINLSGGQKWRVSFARALYSRAGILVLDDIFSAVDTHVGKHLYEKALTGKLGQGRTRILVTHHVALCLPKTKYSVLLENGVVAYAGMTDELKQNGILTKILAYDIEDQKKEDSQTIIDDKGNLSNAHSGRYPNGRRTSALSQASVELIRTRSQAMEDHRPDPKKFVEDEKREVGHVKLTTYNAYVKAGGGYIAWTLLLLVFLAGNAIIIGRSYWVSLWTRSYGTEAQTFISLLQQPMSRLSQLGSELHAVELDPNLRYYLSVYLLISLTYWVMGSLKYLCAYTLSIQASRKLFDELSRAILWAPLRFLDTTPMGRILNRFTADFNMVDSRLANDFSFALHSGMSALAVIIAGVFVSPFMLVASLVLLIICIWYARRYLAGAREVKRLESNAKSPVFEQFGSVLTGIGTIRAFGNAEAYLKRMQEKIDTHCRAYFHLWLFTRWMSLRVGFVGSVFLTIMGALVVSIRQIDAPLAGFALSFSLGLSECIIWMLRQYANVELDMNAIERIVEYSEMPTESLGGQNAPAAWPTKGVVEANDLVVSYAPDLPPVLRGLTFSIKPNERVGVVGRTGAGKSSLTLALFRFLEATSGTIYIDGIDISKIKLFDLRSRLAIIPQDPVLFSGTVRSNLDAFNHRDDAQLRDALARVHLTSTASGAQSGITTPSQSETGNDATQANANIFRSLNSKISEGGLNLSQGQRQLLCLARAIVSRPKIMVLDEATSSVDMETDALIQRSIREEFADSTLIVIAHRLSTIADFDRILVLGEGQVLEFDSPKNLLSIEGGVFRGMVQESGERKELEQIIAQKTADHA